MYNMHGRYAEWTARLHARTPVGVVFVASDLYDLDAAALERRFPRRPYRFVTLRRADEGHAPLWARTLEALSDIALLLRVDAVLEASSNWATPVVAAIFAQRPTTPLSNLCVLTSALRRAPVLCLGKPGFHKHVSGFFVPRKATAVPTHALAENGSEERTERPQYLSRGDKMKRYRRMRNKRAMW